jgi:hypothetical protein
VLAFAQHQVSQMLFNVGLSGGKAGFKHIERRGIVLTTDFSGMGCADVSAHIVLDPQHI